MKVGDYVRTRDGIAKIEEIRNDVIILDAELDWTAELFGNQYLKKGVIKSSPNIIDLFEEQDLVVIEYYSLRYKERVTRLFEVTFKNGEYINLSNAKCDFLLVNEKFNKGDKELKPIIKSIVTHEQFESIEYRIGE